jgi:sugar phosphate isomerase/epimerase
MSSAALLGVSPAFMLSEWGEGFGPEEYVRSLRKIAAMDFGAFQLEVFHQDQLPVWSAANCRRVRDQAQALGLVPTQLVGHFLVDRLTSARGLSDPAGPELFKRLAEIAGRFPGCRVLTLPVGPWEEREIGIPEREVGRLQELYQRFADRVAELVRVAVQTGLILALEVLPYSLLGGSEGFLRLAALVGSPCLGLNLDTGHLWACKEQPRLAVMKLAGRIFGTHLCDNFANENLKLRPGAGTIAWEGLFRALRAAGYAGSLDLEIRCLPGELEREYAAGLSYVRSLLRDAGGSSREVEGQARSAGIGGRRW